MPVRDFRNAENSLIMYIIHQMKKGFFNWIAGAIITEDLSRVFREP
jgi:hypothetical protein